MTKRKIIIIHYVGAAQIPLHFRIYIYIYGHGCYYCIFNDFGFVHEFSGYYAEAQSSRLWRAHNILSLFTVARSHLHTDSYFDSVCFYSKCSSPPSRAPPQVHFFTAIPYDLRIIVDDDIGHRPVNTPNVTI